MQTNLTKDFLTVLKNQEVVNASMLVNFLGKYGEYLTQLPNKRLTMECLSALNRIEKETTNNCVISQTQLKVGDVCFIDFGHAYMYEAGYQHFGIIIKISHYKIFVVPMTSNQQTQRQLKEGHDKEQSHVFDLGWIAGLTKQSVCFLNDAKFINAARVIDVKGFLPPESYIFRKLKKRLFETIF